MTSWLLAIGEPIGGIPKSVPRPVGTRLESDRVWRKLRESLSPQFTHRAAALLTDHTLWPQPQPAGHSCHRLPSGSPCTLCRVWACRGHLCLSPIPSLPPALVSVSDAGRLCACLTPGLSLRLPGCLPPLRARGPLPSPPSSPSLPSVR